MNNKLVSNLFVSAIIAMVVAAYVASDYGFLVGLATYSLVGGIVLMILTALPTRAVVKQDE